MTTAQGLPPLLKKYADDATAEARKKAIKAGKSKDEVERIKFKVTLDDVLKGLKKVFACNGHINRDESEEKLIGDVVQLQGDQRKNISEFLKKEFNAKEDMIQIHGF